MVHLTPIRVHFRDLDPYSHVNHSVYVTWFEIGRTEALRDNGILLAGPHASGYQFVVSELEIRYRKPALADEIVHIESSIVELRGASSRWQQRVLRGDELLADGTVRIGLVGPDGRVARMPDDMKAQLTALMP
ncbi:MAG: thioesterase family protein [Actinomycetota bacterium]